MMVLVLFATIFCISAILFSSFQLIKLCILLFSDPYWDEEFPIWIIALHLFNLGMTLYGLFNIFIPVMKMSLI